MKEDYSAKQNSRTRMMIFPALLLLLAATASLVPTSCASNLLRKASLNDGDVSALNRSAVGDSPNMGGMGVISPDSALSLRLDSTFQSFQQTSLLVSTTSLTGYLMRAVYDDAACTKLLFAAAYFLNTCRIAYRGGYTKLTATAADHLRTYYSDKECTMVTETEAPETYSSGCSLANPRTYVSTDGVLTASTAIVAVSRCVVVSIIFPCHSRQSLSCCFLRLLIKLRSESCKTTCDLANVTLLKDTPT